MTIDVLIVDDDLGAAESYRDLLAVRPGLRALALSDPHEAIEAVRQHTVKVAILDQRMPQMKGSDLVNELLAIDPDIRRILVTGQRMTRKETEELGKAISGFQRYMHKDEILHSLPGAVFEQYVSYLHAKPQVESTDTILAFRRGFLGARYRVAYVLARVLITEQEHIPEAQWHEVERIEAGITEERTVQFKLSERVKVEDISATTLQATLGLKPPQIPGFQAGLKSVIENRLSLTEEMVKERTVTRKLTFALPAEPLNPDSLYVRSRSYQQADIHQQLVCDIRRTCGCCGLSDRLMIKLPRQVARVATRQVDTRSDGSVHPIRTGDLEFT